jgi:hypothetical protein
MRRCLLALLVGCLLVAPAASATPFTLSLDPAQSLLTVSEIASGTPLLGPVELSGTITIDVDALPSGSFTVTQLDAIGSGGIVLANGSGSGVHGPGAMLFSTPFFVDVTVPGFVGPAANLGFPPPLGILTPTGDNLAILSVGFVAEFQLTATETLQLQIFAVPEPGALFGIAATLMVAFRSRRRG